MVESAANVGKPFSGWAKSFTYGLLIVGILIVANRFNPLDYVMEAGPAAYYQAKIAYERGTNSARDSILDVTADGKITMHEYSETVFPLFLKSVSDGESVFPSSEQKKSLELLRDDLRSSTGAARNNK